MHIAEDYMYVCRKRKAEAESGEVAMDGEPADKQARSVIAGSGHEAEASKLRQNLYLARLQT